MINSFDLIGAATLVDPHHAARWCGIRSPDRGESSETEAGGLATIEEKLPAAVDGLLDLVFELIEEEIR